jgi:hypothetical protein
LPGLSAKDSDDAETVHDFNMAASSGSVARTPLASNPGSGQHIRKWASGESVRSQYIGW